MAIHIIDEANRCLGCKKTMCRQGPRKKLIRTTAGLEGNEHGLLVVDDHYMTTKEGVFAAGDVVTDSKTVVHAVEGAKCAVDAMIEYMENQ